MKLIIISFKVQASDLFRGIPKNQKDRHCEGGIPIAIGKAIPVHSTEVGIALLLTANALCLVFQLQIF